MPSAEQKNNTDLNTQAHHLAMFSWASVMKHSAGGVAPQRKAEQPSQATGQLGSQRPSAITEAGATAEATDAEKRSERRRARSVGDDRGGARACHGGMARARPRRPPQQQER